MTKVRIYQDVDGVINADQPQGWGKTTQGLADGGDRSFKIHWAPALIEALLELDVEVVWCTTWRDHANKSIAPLTGWGMGARVIHPPEEWMMQEWSIHWKRLAVAADQRANPGPFIWLDDELGASDVFNWDSALVIPIHYRTGITPANLQAMRDYIEKSKEVAA